MWQKYVTWVSNLTGWFTNQALQGKDNTDTVVKIYSQPQTCTSQVKKRNLIIRLFLETEDVYVALTIQKLFQIGIKRAEIFHVMTQSCSPHIKIKPTQSDSERGMEKQFQPKIHLSSLAFYQKYI